MEPILGRQCGQNTYSVPELRSQPGEVQPAGASSKWANSKAGETVQPTRVQSPRLRADCQAWGGTRSCGRSPSFRRLPRRCVATAPPCSEIDSSSAAPPYQCQISAASTRCQAEISP